MLFIFVLISLLSDEFPNFYCRTFRFSWNIVWRYKKALHDVKGNYCLIIYFLFRHNFRALFLFVIKAYFPPIAENCI